MARILTFTLGLAALWTIVSFATNSAATPTASDKAPVVHDDTRSQALNYAPV